MDVGGPVNQGSLLHLVHEIYGVGRRGRGHVRDAMGYGDFGQVLFPGRLPRAFLAGRRGGGRGAEWRERRRADAAARKGRG